MYLRGVNRSLAAGACLRARYSWKLVGSLLSLRNEELTVKVSVISVLVLLVLLVLYTGVV